MNEELLWAIFVLGGGLALLAIYFTAQLLDYLKWR